MKLRIFALGAMLAAMFVAGPALADPVECGDKASLNWVNSRIGGYFNGGLIGKLKVVSTQGTVSSTAKKLVCKVRVRHTFLNEDVEFVSAHLIFNLKSDGSIRDGDLVFLEGSKSR